MSVFDLKGITTTSISIDTQGHTRQNRLYVEPKELEFFPTEALSLPMAYVTVNIPYSTEALKNLFHRFCSIDQEANIGFGARVSLRGYRKSYGTLSLMPA